MSRPLLVSQPSTTASILLSPNSPTPTNGNDKSKFNWQRPKLTRSGASGHSSHRVTFSSSSKGSKAEKDQGYSSASHSDSSRPPSPGPSIPIKELWSPLPDDHKRLWQKVDRQNEATVQTPIPHPSPQEPQPFLVYTDHFLSVLGPTPTLTCLVSDTRAPYFYNSGIYSHRTSTLFLSSPPLPDASPSAAPSRNLTSLLSKVDFYSPTDFTRDKVRTPDHTYMPRSGCAYKTGIVLCAQGTLAEPSALIYMDAKRPHKTYTLLTNFSGIPLNAPHSCVAHPDGSLWFTDPHLTHSPSFRPKPRLPPMLYRFDLADSDLRPMAHDLVSPTALAFAGDFKTLYVLDAPPPVAPSAMSGSSHSSSSFPTGVAFPSVMAYTVSAFGSNKSPFLTHKRLFAMPMTRPTSLATDLFGNLYVGCADGVHVFDVGGSVIGRVMVENPVTGLCFGKDGELWVSTGYKLWRIQLDKSLRPSILGV